MADTLKKNLLLTDFKSDPECAERPSFGASTKERMKVYLRIRPPIAGEGDTKCIDIVNEQSVVMNPPKDSFTLKSRVRGIDTHSHRFEFSSVFGPETSQSNFFNSTVLGLLKDLLDGHNCLVFTYGVTNAGKTHTIQGTTKDGGILPRAFDVIFNSIVGKEYTRGDLKPCLFRGVTLMSADQQNMTETFRNYLFNYGNKENIDLSALLKMDSTINSTRSDASVCSQLMYESVSSQKLADDPSQEAQNLATALEGRIADQTVLDLNHAGSVQYSVWVSYAEIYNEYIYDLLAPVDAMRPKHRTALKLTADQDGNPYIKGLKEVLIRCPNEAFKVLAFGRRNLRFAATKHNENSSRSHCIFTVKVVRVMPGENSKDSHAKLSRLSFVDLAGSERNNNKAANKGDLMKESSNINKSIMTLGKCIDHIRYNQHHPTHPIIIPFRESKLTRLFQAFFLGKAKACMIVNASQNAAAFDETYHVMKFSAVAKQVTMKSKCFSRDQPALVIAGAKPSTKNLLALGSPSVHVEDEYTFDEVVSLVEELQGQLQKEKKERQDIERSLREDFYVQTKQLLIEANEEAMERHEEEKAMLEENFEKRLELLTKTVRKTSKKRRLEDMDEDDLVPSDLLKAEEEEVKLLSTMNLALKHEMAEARRLHQMLPCDSQSETHQDAAAELTEARETLQVQNRQLEEAQVSLVNALENLQDKEVELEKSKEALSKIDQDFKKCAIIETLQRQLSVCSEQLDVARLKLDERDKKIVSLEARLIGGHDDGALKANCVSLTRQVTDLEQMTRESEEERQKIEFEKDELSIKVEKYEKLLAEHRSVLQDNETFIEQLNKQNATLKAQGNTEGKETAGDAGELSKLREELNDSRKRFTALTHSNAALEQEKVLLQCSVNDLQNQLKSSRLLQSELPLDATPGKTSKEASTPKNNSSHSVPMRRGTPSRPATPSSVQRLGNMQMITRLEKSLADSRQLAEAQERDIAVKAKALVAKDEVIKELQSTCREIELQMTSKQKTMDNLQTVLSAAQAELQLTTERFQGDIATTKVGCDEQLVAKEMEIKQLQQRLENKMTELNRLLNANATMEGEKKKYVEAHRKEVNEQREKEKGLQSCLDDATTERDTLQRENIKLQTKAKEMLTRKSYNKIGDQGLLTNELSDAYDQLDSLRGQLVTKNEEMTRLQQNTKSLHRDMTEAHAQEVKDLNQQIALIKSQRTEAGLSCVEYHQSSVDELRKMIADYRVMVDGLEGSRDCQHDEKAALLVEMELSRQKILAAEKESADNKEKFEDKVLECKTLAAEIRRLTREEHALQKERNQLRATVDKMAEGRGNLSDWIEDMDDATAQDRSKNAERQIAMSAAKDKQIKELTMAKAKALDAMRESHDLVKAKTAECDHQRRLADQATRDYEELLRQMQNEDKIVTPAANKSRIRCPANTNAPEVLKEITDNISTPSSSIITRSRSRGVPLIEEVDEVDTTTKKKRLRKTRAKRMSPSEERPQPTIEDQPKKRGRRKLHRAVDCLASPDDVFAGTPASSSRKEVWLEQASMFLESQGKSLRSRAK